MKVNFQESGRRPMNAAKTLAGLTLALVLFAPVVSAQQIEAVGSKAAETKPAPDVYQTFYLTNVSQQNDLNDIQTDLRNMLPKARLFSIQSQNAISMHGTADDIQLAQKIIADLDRPKKTYRLTFTITEADSGKRTSAHSVVLIAALGQKTVFKEGSRVPIVTGSFDSETTKANTQVQYQDVGLLIEASVDGYADGLRLRTKVEQSALAEEKSGVGPQDPMFHQAVLDGTSALALGKPLTLGSFDIPGTARNESIEVVAEVVR
jgi:type II secretory pathway component GspD/PulD (secretin)